jgi:hypothetical protein
MRVAPSNQSQISGIAYVPFLSTAEEDKLKISNRLIADLEATIKD